MRVGTVVLACVAALAVPCLAGGRGMLGLGGTFWYLGLTLEGFAEIALGEMLAARVGAGMLAGGDYTGFLASGAALVTVGEDFRLYLGVEGLAGVFVRPVQTEVLAWDWFVGSYIRLGKSYGVFVQVRFLKSLSGIAGGGVSLGGVGFPFLGAGLCVDF